MAATSSEGTGLTTAPNFSTIPVRLDDVDAEVKVFCYHNFYQLDPKTPILFCFHGNSSCAETFAETLKYDPGVVQVVAFDLPGCGRSDDLPATMEYTMQIVGDIMSKAIASFKADPTKTYFFGHSLGGHLLPFIEPKPVGVIIAGTPPLSSAADFGEAFKPGPDAMKLLPLLSKADKFTEDEARPFIEHTGAPKEHLPEMIRMAMRTDGRFRAGCLSTLADKDQVAWMSQFGEGKVAIVHAKNDGVIDKRYLTKFEGSSWLYSGKVVCLEGSHMTPLNNAGEILEIVRGLVA